MATKLSMTVPSIPVQNSDVVFEVRIDGELLGRLKISRGGVDWYRRNARTAGPPTGTYRWKEFAAWMES